MTLRKAFVEWIEVDENQAGQRLDHFLQRHLKGVPKSHLYRLMRAGEVRVNSRRVEASYRLQLHDRLRIPPVRSAAPREPGAVAAPLPASLRSQVVYEDEGLLVLNKPAGVAVHGGSGIRLGVIEQLRRERPEARFLELVHRLDRDTSGLLLVAKKRAVLVALHELLRHDDGIEKHYRVLAQGRFTPHQRRVTLPLYKYLTADGERRVMVRADGKPAATVFTCCQHFPDVTLLDARLLTGRTHQIRVHLAHLGHPIAGDDKYGDFEWNRQLAQQGMKRMYLHAFQLGFTHPLDGRALTFEAPLPPAFTAALTLLGK